MRRRVAAKRRWRRSTVQHSAEIDKLLAVIDLSPAMVRE
jgi:hypothetical protein